MPLNFKSGFWVILACWLLTVMGILVLGVQKTPRFRVQELNMKKWITVESVKELQNPAQDEGKISEKLIQRLQKDAQDQGIVFVEKVWAHPQEVSVQKRGGNNETF